MVNRYGQTDIVQALLKQGTSPNPYKTGLGQAARLGGIALAEWGKRKESEKRQSALADALAGLNGGALTGEGPTTDAAGRAPIGDPQLMARLLSDPNTAHVGQALLGRALQPAPERYEDVLGPQGRPIAQRSSRTGKVEPYPKNPYAQDPYNLGPGEQRFDGQNNLIASGPAKPELKNVPNVGLVDVTDPRNPRIVTATPKDDLITVPGVGVMSRTTNRYVGQGSAPGRPQAEGPQFEAPPNPTENLSPKIAADLMTDEYKKANAELTDMRKSLEPAQKAVRLAERFQELLAVQDTGGWYRKIPGAQTVESALDPQIEEMWSITDQLTPLMRQGLPGASSDRDVVMFRGATVSPDKRPEVNRNIILGFQTAAQNAQDRLAFMEEYLGQHKTLRGADAQWRKYLEANPIFDPNSTPERPALNGQRQSWRDYFTPSKRKTAPLNEDERAELEQLRKEFRQ